MSLLLDTLKTSSGSCIENAHIDNISHHDLELKLEAIDHTLAFNIAPDKIHAQDFNSTTLNNKTPCHIEKNQSFSNFIDKINQHNKREKFKTNISIVIFMTLVLISNGLYLYIKTQASSQEFHLAQNNAILNDPSNNTSIASITNAPVNKSATAISVIKLLPSNPIIKNKTKPTKPAVTAAATKASLASQIAKTSEQKNISIVHTQKVDPIHLLINDAYQAFHAKQYHLSEKLYKQVLSREPKNRDALLGLAAIAIKDMRYEYARQKYQYLLHLNPADSFAIAGLSGIKKYLNSQLNESQFHESQLKFMLKQHPDAAHLYFALGTQYSAQLKWPEAQSAYFSAWSADNKNADYCYNLAISLDHLNKKKQALRFYKLSLTLQATSHSHFSQTEIEQRILSLQASIQ